jgi:predicted DNA-binding transcriptional regulator YafY
VANTSSRTLRLLSLLQARRWWPGPHLAAELGVSARTLRRDVDRLRDLGYPVDAAPGVDGGYALAPGAALPPLVVDDEEAMALAVAVQAQLASGTGDEATVRAFTKIVQVMPKPLRRRLDAVQAATTPARWGDEPTERIDHRVLSVLALGCRDHERVRFSYTNAAGEDSVRRTEPRQLVPLGRRWYLVGYDLDRADWRTFRVDRVRDAEGTGTPFAPRTPPFDDVAAFVLAGVQGAEARGEGRFHVEAVVRTPAADLRGRLGGWATVTPRDDGSCLFTMDTDRLDGAVFALGVAGVPFEVLGPPELREHLHGWSERLGAAAETVR